MEKPILAATNRKSQVGARLHAANAARTALTCKADLRLRQLA